MCNNTNEYILIFIFFIVCSKQNMNKLINKKKYLTSEIHNVIF